MLILAFVFFLGGLEIKPCESRLEFVHTPKKIKKTNDQKTEKNNQRGRKKYIACKINCFTFFWAYGLGEPLAIFFSFIFLLSWILREKFNCQIFFGDFHSDILLTVLMICKKIFVHFFWGSGHEPKIDVSLDFGFHFLGFGFWSFDFGSWSFDFGSWRFDFGSWRFDFGVSILDLGVSILDLGVWILDLGVLILDLV